MVFWLKVQGGASWFLDFNRFRHIRTNQYLSLFGWMIKYILQPSFKHNNPKRAFIWAKFCVVVDLQCARGHLLFLGQNSTCSLSTRLALFMSLTFNPALLWKAALFSGRCSAVWFEDNWGTLGLQHLGQFQSWWTAVGNLWTGVEVAVFTAGSLWLCLLL